MHVDTGLSTRFVTDRNAHQVGLLVTVAGERPPVLGAQNVTVELHVRHGGVAGVIFYQRIPIEEPEENRWIIRLGELSGTSPLQLGVTLFVNDRDERGAVEVAEVRVTGDVLTAQGVEHRVVTTPVVATLDGANHVEPSVERTLIRLQATQARADAITQANLGHFDSAAHTLRVARDSLALYGTDAPIAEAMEDLATESARLAEREHDPSDHIARRKPEDGKGR